MKLVGQVLAPQDDDLSLLPSTQVWWRMLVISEDKSGGYTGALASQSRLIGEPRVLVRDCLKKQSRWLLRNNT